MPQPADDWVIRPPASGTGEAPAEVDDWVVKANPVTAVGVKDLIKEAVPFNYGAKGAARVRQLRGEDYEQALEDERKQTEQFREAHPGYAIAANLAGGVVPGLGLLGKLGQGASTLGTVGRSAAIGAGIGGVSGYNEDDSADSAAIGAGIGTGLGAVLPAAVAGVAGTAKFVAKNPRYVKFKEDLSSSKLGQLASDERGSVPLPGAGGGAITPPSGAVSSQAFGDLSPGAKAAAYQTLANYLASSGKTVDELRTTLQKAIDSGKLHSSGQAQNVLALIDLDPSLAEAAGSAMRKSSEVKRQGTAFLKARQRGIAEDDLPPSAGLPTREVGAPRITGKQSIELNGTDYGAGQKNAVPMGQGERINDMLKRSMLIKDSEHHGFGANAHLTDDLIMARARQEAQPAYEALYRTGDNHNISATVQPILDRWVTALEDPAISRLPQDVRKTLAGDIKMLFAPEGRTVTHIEAFDLAKRRLDDKIENAINGLGNKDKVLAEYYTRIKQDLLKGMEVNGQRVGGIDNHPVLGKLYDETRQKWSSAMEDREMIQLGRDLFEGKAPASAIDAVTSDDRLKLVREGYVGGYQDKSANTTRSHDRTKWFDNERQEEILSKLVPRSDDSGAKFADKPQRVGRYLANEKRMVDSNYEVTGNSKTADRAAADIKFDQVGKVSNAIEQWKQGGTLSNIGFRVAQSILEKYFGMSAEAASALGRMMFTADKEKLALVLSEVQKRMGKDRFEHFSRLMQQSQAAFTPGATAGLVGGSAGQAASQALP